MKMKVLVLMISLACAGCVSDETVMPSVQEPGTLYACWTSSASRALHEAPSMILGEDWVKLHGFKQDATHHVIGAEQRWLITSKGIKHEIVLFPDGVAGYYDFSKVKNTKPRSLLFCYPA